MGGFPQAHSSKAIRIWPSHEAPSGLPETTAPVGPGGRGGPLGPLGPRGADVGRGRYRRFPADHRLHRCRNRQCSRRKGVVPVPVGRGVNGRVVSFLSTIRIATLSPGLALAQQAPVQSLLSQVLV